jgi:hypothetical protein
MRNILKFSRQIALSLTLGSSQRMSPAPETRITDGLQPFVNKGILAGAVTLVSSAEHNWF